MFSWPSRMNIHHRIVIYIHICVISKKKKKSSEGSLGVYICRNISYRDYVQRGVKTGINYPYRCVVTCIRLIKTPLWPTIVSILPPILSDISLSNLKTSFWERLTLAMSVKRQNWQQSLYSRAHIRGNLKKCGQTMDFSKFLKFF